MSKALPKGTKFIVPKTGNKKYTALIPIDGKIKRVSFGDRRYEQYKDSTPVKKWSKSDHGDKTRRASYRARHGSMKCADGKKCITKKYSPAWFSYYFLW